jgi:hypothetical protein
MGRQLSDRRRADGNRRAEVQRARRVAAGVFGLLFATGISLAGGSVAASAAQTSTAGRPAATSGDVNSTVRYLYSVSRWGKSVKQYTTCKEVGFSAEVPDGAGVDDGDVGGGEALPGRISGTPQGSGGTFSTSHCVTTQKVNYAYHMGASSAVANLTKKYLGLIAVADSYHVPNPVCHPYILFSVKYKGKTLGSFKVKFGDGCWSSRNGWDSVVGRSKYGYAYCITDDGGPCPITWVFPVFPYDTVVDASLYALNSKGTYSNVSKGHNVAVKLVKLGNNVNTGP